MTYTAVIPKAGIFADQAPADASGYYINGSNIRFIQGRAETIGGFQKFTQNQTTGIARVIKSWSQINGRINTAVASASAIQVGQGGDLSDVTPLRATGSLSAPFTTASGSSVVTVSHTSHGVSSGDRVIFSSASEVNGITVAGHYVATKVDANSYTINTTALANASGAGGGSPSYEYLISSGPTDSVFNFGWGVGTWNQGTWGTPRDSSDIVLNARTWSLEPYGEDFLAVHNDGGTIFYWDATTGASNRAAALANAPTANLIVVSAETRHVIAFGSDGDPLKISWCAQDNITAWTALSTNDAGDQRLIDGSEIRAAIQSRSAILVLTDTAVYEMSYIGGEYVWRFRRIGATGPICGPNAITERDGLVAWMTLDGTFMAYDGTLRQLSCPVRRHVFDDINIIQRVKINAGVNGSFGEFWWSYPSANSSEPDQVVVWAYSQGADIWWLSSDLGRTAWDSAGVINNPIAASSDRYIYEHETGASADGSNLTAFVETGDVSLDDGDQLYNISDVIPDLDLVGADENNKVAMTLKARIYPLGDQTVDGPHFIDNDTRKLSVRSTGRQINYRLQSDSTALFWRAGKQRFEVELSGGQR